MSAFPVIVHYHFKKGLEKEGLQHLMSVLRDKATELGGQNLGLWQSDQDPTHVMGMGWWDSLEDSNRFQAYWNSQMGQLSKYLASPPVRECYPTHISGSGNAA
ncbi:MAG: hypothetical protein ACOYKZ_08225, partial [Chlamydiia bacterium]